MDEQSLEAALEAVSLDDVVQLTRDLVDIPSPPGGERNCALFLQGYLQEAGLEARLQEIEEGRANVVGLLPGGDGPSLMLNGHLDTTYYGNLADDYPRAGIQSPNDLPQSYEIDGGIYGLGAHNMKGGVAAAFVAVRALKRSGARLRGNVLVSGVVGETEKAPVRAVHRVYDGPKYHGSGYGAQYLVTHCEPLDYAIIAEPSNLYVVNGQPGYIFVKIIVRGEAVYLSPRYRGWGMSALEDASEVIRKLSAWGPEYATAHAFDTGLGIIRPIVTVGAIDGGWPFAPTSIPGICHIYVTLRTTPQLTAAQVLAAMREQLDSLSSDRGRLTYDLEVYASNQPSVNTPADSPFCRAAVTVIEQKIGLPTWPFEPGSGDASNDTNVFRRHGVPAFKCGPTTRLEPNGKEMSRRNGLHVYRDDLLQAARFYVHMAFVLCDRSRTDTIPGS